MAGAFDPLDTEKTAMNLGNSLGDLPTMKLDDQSIGKIDRYELIEKLGEGGFGAVYGARDTVSKTLVALKALPSEISCDADEMESIRDNFALVSKLHHPGIASLLHLHLVERPDVQAQSALGVKAGDFLVVMEYAPGSTLFALRRSFPGQKIPFEQAVEICRPIVAALDFAHSQRVLHRDIKPKNVMVAQSATEATGNRQEAIGETTSAYSLMPSACIVKVLDFGLAAEIRSSMSRKSKDPESSKSGTPLYMAPEQWRGTVQGPAADQYALAAMFYELVSGAVPFKSAFDTGDFQIMLNAVVKNPVEPLKELSKKQNAVLLRALAKDPEKRFASCGDFVAALAGGRVRGAGSGSPQRAQKGAKNGGRRFIAAAVVLGLVAIGGYFGVKGWTVRRTVRALQEQLAAETVPQASSLPTQSPQDAGGTVQAEPKIPQPEPGKKWTVDLGEGVAMEFMPIAAGSFDKHTAPEGPRLMAVMSEFWLGKTEVTIEQWRRFLEESGHTSGTDFADDAAPLRQQNGAYLLSLKKTGMDWQQPMCEINWNAAMAFCDWLTEREQKAGRLPEGLIYSLPTEAQWEYACRSGRDTGFFWGNDLGEGNCNAENQIDGKDDAQVAWFRKKGLPTGTTMKVGTFEPNGFGLFDMHGNVSEWCRDFYAPGYDSRASEYDPEYRVRSEERVCRGGSWDDPASQCKAWSRWHQKQYDSFEYLGLRVALVWNGQGPKNTGETAEKWIPCNFAVGTYFAKITLFRDGEVLFSGTCPTSTDLMPGKYDVEIQLAGHQTLKQSVEVTEQQTDFDFKPEPLNGPKEGEKWTAELGVGVTMEFMPIPAGSFQMGSNNGDDDEKPVHKVTLTKPFWMGRTEVTQKQYQQIMETNPSKFKGEENPVEQVSWNDAVKFCEKLTEKERQTGRLPEGFEYALPTEAQWEYACRAGNGFDYCFGNKVEQLCEYSNYKDSLQFNTKIGAPKRSFNALYGGKIPAPVGSLSPNLWGLCDMHGNVWEWCVDEWFESYDGAPIDGSQRNKGVGSYRVVRGGSWDCDAASCRSATRNGGDPSFVGEDLGFRPIVRQK